MRLEINLADNSSEAQVLASIVSRDRVSPEEAVRSLLRGVRPSNTAEDTFKDPTDTQTLVGTMAQTRAVPGGGKGRSKIPGLPSEPMNAEDAAIVDEALAEVMAARRERSEHIFGA
jgi:hypothetical protein